VLPRKTPGPAGKTSSWVESRSPSASNADHQLCERHEGCGTASKGFWVWVFQCSCAGVSGRRPVSRVGGCYGGRLWGWTCCGFGLELTRSRSSVAGTRIESPLRLSFRTGSASIGGGRTELARLTGDSPAKIVVALCAADTVVPAGRDWTALRSRACHGFEFASCRLAVKWAKRL